MISVGTSNFFRSSVKSVSENALMQSYAFLWPDIMPCSHHELMSPWETLAPGRLKPKKGPLATSRKNCERSAKYALRKPSKTSMGKPPGIALHVSFGISAVGHSGRHFT